MWKKHLKWRYLRKIVKKNRKNAEFWFVLSSDLITIDMWFKGQLGDHVVAIRGQWKKTGKKFSFFQKF